MKKKTTLVMYSITVNVSGQRGRDVLRDGWTNGWMDDVTCECVMIS